MPCWRTGLWGGGAVEKSMSTYLDALTTECPTYLGTQLLACDGCSALWLISRCYCSVLSWRVPR
jgi:hypothetical protein